MAKAPPLATRLRELLAQATPDDVKELDDQIAEKEKELDSLRADRKLLATAAGVEEPKKPHWTQRKKAAAAAEANGTGPSAPPPAPSSPPSTNFDGKRKKVLLYLKQFGPKSMQALSEQTGIARQGPGNLASVVAHAWFHVSPESLVSLTSHGDRAAATLAS